MQTTHLTPRIIKIMNILIAILILCGCSLGNVSNYEQNNNAVEEQPYVEQETVQEDEAVEEYVFVPTFAKEPIPQDIREKMWGVTISAKSHLGFDDLSYLTITYLGYDDVPHEGHMIVAAEIADEVLNIFRELYEAQFPIEKMNLPCEYDGIDELSMEDNNTSAFNDRPIEGSGGLSYHQLGRAIDINPLINPYIKFSNNMLLPETAGRYLDRTLGEKGMITDDCECVRIFEKYGWVWGGTWHSLKDYQHFEKH